MVNVAPMQAKLRAAGTVDRIALGELDGTAGTLVSCKGVEVPGTSDCDLFHMTASLN